MQVSVIISTYDAPERLALVLRGYALQTHRPCEVIVADDGSDGRTTACVRRLQRQTDIDIRHVWHADRGFRKSTILNRATEEARGEYVVFTDGDCIPRADFVATHVSLSAPGTFLSGGCVRLPPGLSDRMSDEDVRTGRATDRAWLAAHGLAGRELRRLARPGSPLATACDALTTTRATWNGCNSSTWLEHVLAVNGHDERMRYGGLDREMGERLVNLGVRPRQVRHRAICVHLAHARPYATAESRDNNLAIRAATRRLAATWTPFGIRRDPDREQVALRSLGQRAA